jgi:hypothetical protein
MAVLIVVGTIGGVGALLVSSASPAIAATTLTEVPAPNYGQFTDVSCTSPGNCTAVGSDDYYGPNGIFYYRVPALVTETNGTWGVGHRPPRDSWPSHWLSWWRRWSHWLFRRLRWSELHEPGQLHSHRSFQRNWSQPTVRTQRNERGLGRGHCPQPG